jgi:hypothetical protein
MEVASKLRGMIRARPVLAGALAWVVGATASVAVGLLALSLVGADLTGAGDPPIVADPVKDIAGSPPPSAGPTTPAVSPTGTQGSARLNSTGGYVLAQCRSGDAYLVYWSPAPGYRVRDVERGPRDDARVRFEGADHDVEMRVTCAGGQPQAAIERHS